MHLGNGDISIKIHSITNVGQMEFGVKIVSMSNNECFQISDSWHELNDMADVRKTF